MAANSFTISGNLVNEPTTITNLTIAQILGIPVNNINSETIIHLSSSPLPSMHQNDFYQPKTEPILPQFSPADMEIIKNMKLERRREQNRICAAKSRKRQLERLNELKDKVKDLTNENLKLENVVKNMTEHVVMLNQQVINHTRIGCNIPDYRSTHSFNGTKDSGY